MIRTIRRATLFVLLAVSSATRADSELPATLRGLVEGSPLAVARTGIVVAAVDSGEVLYAREPDALLNPASNVKLVTSAAALAKLGPEFRFSTEFLVDRAPAGGEARTLYVRGRGDPSIVTERLWAIAGELQHLGLRRVAEVVLDESYFDGEHFGPGFDQENSDRAYLAPAGALSLNYNAVEVVVSPAAPGQKARVEIEPSSAFFQVENRTSTVGRRARGRVAVSTDLRGGRERVVVEGRVPASAKAHAVWRRIDDPALYFGHSLAALLELRGVRVGRIRLGRTPESARLLYVSQSDELADIVRRLNKTSNNFTAEQILRVLGAELRGTPGTWAKGVEVVEDFLGELGIARGSYVMRNGSGLNDANRFTPRQLVTLLRAMWGRSTLLPEYLVSLPVAARDGTIRWRMDGTAAAGRLRAKTGTLDGVVSLSGYVEDGRGRMLAFSILVNESPGRPGVLKAVDAIGAALASSGAPAGTVVALAPATGPAVALAPATGPAVVRPAAATSAPPTSAPAGDQAKRLATWYALATTGDTRNQLFLREALRGAADPDSRLALAECVYLADPDGDSARRAFLDAVAADPDGAARLWALLPDLESGPVISSLADLAADGEGDALRRLMELAGRELADERLATAVGDALAGVAASAPDEVLAAFRAAPAASVDAIAGRLVGGVVRSDEKEHPFPALLRGLAAKDDPATPFAKALLARLDEARKAAGIRTAPAPSAK